jgi:hypothetical protein
MMRDACISLCGYRGAALHPPQWGCTAEGCPKCYIDIVRVVHQVPFGPAREALGFGFTIWYCP